MVSILEYSQRISLQFLSPQRECASFKSYLFIYARLKGLVRHAENGLTIACCGLIIPNTQRSKQYLGTRS